VTVWFNKAVLSTPVVVIDKFDPKKLYPLSGGFGKFSRTGGGGILDNIMDF
jgi:hypothetical protein